MSLFVKILLIVLPILYILSPIDMISDFIPFAGWTDDLAILGLLIYFLTKGRLPGIFNRFGGPGTTYQGKTRRQQHNDAGQSGPQPESEAARKTPWEILEIDPSATLEEIQSAYRQAAQAYHPDKVSHLGSEFQELAKQKFVEIQEAYQFLIKHVDK